MKHLPLVLVLFLFSCKKEDPKPQETTQYNTTFTFSCRYTAQVKIDWVGNALPDTSFTMNVDQINFIKTVKKKTIFISSSILGRSTGDTSRIYLNIKGKNHHTAADTVFSNRSFDIW